MAKVIPFPSGAAAGVDTQPGAGVHVPAPRVYQFDLPDCAQAVVKRPPQELVPSDLLLRPAPPLRENEALRALGRISRLNALDYVAQRNAMDAPFQAMAKARWDDVLRVDGSRDGAAVASEASRGEAVPAELDPYKTKAAAGAKAFREEIEIDVFQSRIRKLQKAVRNSAHILDAAAHCDEQSVRWRRLFVTLTYAKVEDWQPGHIREFQRRLADWFRRKCGRTRMRMVWVLELQKRGAVHYHCMIWIRARDYFPNPNKCGWWRHGFCHVLSSKVAINRPVAYMAKYASKATVEQAMSVPKGARMFGVCGLSLEGRRVVRWWRAPTFVRDHFGGAADIRKAQGGYMDRVTGEYLASPWKVYVTPAGRVFAWRDVPADQMERAA